MESQYTVYLCWKANMSGELNFGGGVVEGGEYIYRF